MKDQDFKEEEKMEVAEQSEQSENIEQYNDPVADVNRETAELYFATVRLIDTVTKRGAFEGGELATVGAIRQQYVNWLGERGFINEN